MHYKLGRINELVVALTDIDTNFAELNDFSTV